MPWHNYSIRQLMDDLNNTQIPNNPIGTWFLEFI